MPPEDVIVGVLVERKHEKLHLVIVVGDEVYSEGCRGGEEQGNPQTDLAEGHDTGNPSGAVGDETRHDMDYHDITRLARYVDVAGWIPTPRVNIPVKWSGVPEDDVADERVQSQANCRCY